jgi:Bromodomain extra-terminal - transcription regulation
MMASLATSTTATTGTITTRERKALTEKIRGLGKTEHEELLRILKAHSIQYTQNNNGVFVNISMVEDGVIRQMQKFVDFCFMNMQELDDYDKRLNDCKAAAVGGGGGGGAGYSSNTSYNIISGDDDDTQQATADGASASANGDGAGTASDDAPRGGADDWHGLIASAGENKAGLTAYANSIAGCRDAMAGAAKKKVCTKFNIAKKKYSKKKASDPKAQELVSVLFHEPYSSAAAEGVGDQNQ